MSLKKLKTYILIYILILPATIKAQQHRFARAYIPQDSLCVKEDSAHLSFPQNHEDFTTFYDKLSKLLMTGENRINILHIGGSHVQAGYLSHQLRKDISSLHDSATSQQVKAADMGVLFPFKAVRTNAPQSYVVSHTGYWRASKCISATPDAKLGISGIAAITTDSTSTLTLNLSDETYSYNQLRVLGYSLNDITTPVVVVGQDTIFPDPSDNKPGFLFKLPQQTTRSTITFKNLCDTTGFVVRGLMPISSRSGITYSESGVNGASVASWLRCDALEEELALLPPDLVVFGIGINDAAMSYDKFNPDTFKDNYRRLIAEIKHISPEAALLFITNNDCNQTMRIRKPNLNTARVATAFRELANEYNGAVFDLYQVMGGQGSAANWQRHHLMKKDRVHFTQAGYQLVGNLIFNAIVADFEQQHPYSSNNL